jgi:hypothetical protein
MRVRDFGTDLVVDDHPTFDRWIGVFNFVVAGSCAAIAVSEYQPGGELRDVVLILIVPFATAAAATGLWRALARPSTFLHIDGAAGSVTLVRRTVFRRFSGRWTADQIVRFARVQRPGRDGDPVYRLRLDLAGGASLPAAVLWQTDPAAIDTVVRRANALLGK